MIEIEHIIKRQISGNYIIQRLEIVSGRKSDGIGDQTAFKFEEPSQGISSGYYSRIQNDVYSVKNCLIVFDHNKFFL